MIIVSFFGRVLPALSLTLSHTHIIDMRESSSGLKGTIAIQIKNSEVVANCSLNRFEQPDFDGLHLFVFRAVRILVDFVAFSRGIGMTLILDSFMDALGARRTIHSEDPRLHGISTLIADEAIPILALDHKLATALNHLTATMERPDEILTGCALGIERLTHIISPGAEKKQRWQNLRTALQLTENYLKLITEVSKGPRHGNPERLVLEDVLEARRRAWTVMNRFLEFRKRRNNAPLPLSDFPLLD
jgi:hypothetical protein